MIAKRNRTSLYHSFILDISASDFEEHLGHGVGKNAGDALKFMMWLEIVKKRISSGMEKVSK